MITLYLFVIALCIFEVPNIIKNKNKADIIIYFIMVILVISIGSFYFLNNNNNITFTKIIFNLLNIKY